MSEPSPVVKWMAEKLSEELQGKSRGMFLGWLANDVSTAEQYVYDATDSLSMLYIAETMQTLILNDRNRTSKQVVAYLRDVLMSDEVASATA